MAAAATPLLDSPGDMLAMAPPDLMDGVSAEEVPAVGEAPVEDPAAEEPTEATEDAPEAEATEEPEQAETEPAPAEELPEGVSREGKGYRLEESRYKTIYGNHQFVNQEAPGIIGEPLTRQALEVRQQAYQMQEQLFNDLNSADAGAQGNVLDFVFGDMQRAFRDGEVGSDPTVPFTQAFYERIQQHPDAHAALRFSAAKDLLSEMYAEAARSNDANLFSSAQQFSRKLAGVSPELLKTPAGVEALRNAAERMGLPFYLQDEMAGLAKGADPAAQLRAENERLRSQLSGRDQSTQAAQFDSWKGATNQAIASGIQNDAVTPALASIADSWKSFPKEYQDQVVTPLQREVDKILGQDTGLRDFVRQRMQAAQRATSPQVRAKLTQEIQQAYVFRAQMAADAAKRPILKAAAEWLKGRSAATHARRQAAQTQTAPKGVTSAVPRSVTDGLDKSAFTDANGIFDPDKAARAMSRILPR